MTKIARSSKRPGLFLLVTLLAISSLCAATSHAAIVERVVAVVGDKPILLSDVKQRARPFKQRIYAQLPDSASRAGALSQLYQEVVERLVDEELLARAAAKSNISITAEEVEKAISGLANRNGLTVQQLYEEATRNGLSLPEYRQEIRRQLLDAKMLNLRTQGRMRISEDDMRAAYQRVKREERQALEFRAAWIRFQIPQGAGTLGATRVQRLARQVAQQAREGTDFAQLVQRYSSDPSTKESGGLLEPMVPTQLPENVAAAVVAAEPGDVTDPVRLGDAWLVIQLVERAPSEVPDYEQAKPQLQMRVTDDKMKAARRQWLDSLRKRTHVDVRM